MCDTLIEELKDKPQTPPPAALVKHISDGGRGFDFKYDPPVEQSDGEQSR